MSGIVIYTDGACSGNPGKGGWGFAVFQNGTEIANRYGGESYTTNNVMELTAVIESMKYLQNIKINNYNTVEICSDSTYVIKGLKEWIYGWIKNGWKTSSGDSVKNVDHWKELMTLQKNIKQNWNITYTIVKGHSGITGNERADFLARQGIEEYRGPISHQKDEKKAVQYIKSDAHSSLWSNKSHDLYHNDFQNKQSDIKISNNIQHHNDEKQAISIHENQHANSNSVENNILHKEIYVVQSVFKSLDFAKNLARQIIENKLSFSVNITNIESLHVWEGKIVENKKVLLSCKTPFNGKKHLLEFIKASHCDKLQEIVYYTCKIEYTNYEI